MKLKIALHISKNIIKYELVFSGYKYFDSSTDDEDTLAEDLSDSSQKSRNSSTNNLKEELRISLTSDEGSTSSSDSSVSKLNPGIHSPVEYNLYLNQTNNQLLSPEPQTPSVADVIFLK